MIKLLCILSLAAPIALWAKAPTPALSAPSAPASLPSPISRSEVVLHTSQGDITLALYPEQAPKSVANFLQYVRTGLYDGTIFHRSIPGYLLQGGLYSKDLQPRRTRAPIPNEANNGLSNLRGTLAVARGGDPNSGASQFFINLADNRRLDAAGGQTGLTWGYAVFGRVVKGMAVVDKIAQLPTRPLGPFTNDVSDPLVVIDHANVIGDSSSAQPH